MSHEEHISSDETILRRIPNHPDNTKDRREHGLTATSRALRPRKLERFPSWTRAGITCPRRLLQLEAEKGTNIIGWQVAAISVGAVREFGLDVRASPRDEDPGHCEIVPRERQQFTKSIWSRLATKTRIVYTGRDESGEAPR